MGDRHHGGLWLVLQLILVGLILIVKSIAIINLFFELSYLSLLSADHHSSSYQLSFELFYLLLLSVYDLAST